MIIANTLPSGNSRLGLQCRHHGNMDALSALLGLCAGNPSTGGPVM